MPTTKKQLDEYYDAICAAMQSGKSVVWMDSENIDKAITQIKSQLTLNQSWSPKNVNTIHVTAIVGTEPITGAKMADAYVYRPAY